MSYINSAIKQFKYYKHLGEQSLVKLDDQSILWQANDTSNSIAIIIHHLHGNMLSRWTDFLNSDGEKDFRNRDKEFDDVIKTKQEALEKWESGWACLFSAIEHLSEHQMNDIIYIRNIGHTIQEAINRQLCHYAYHIGQIVFISKMIQDKNWISLSIAKGESKAYNAQKFSKEKERGHFTDEFLKSEND
jgi:hypothetical protein